MEDQIIVIQKHWRGHAQRVKYEKLMMQDIFRFYYSSENETNTPQLTHDISIKTSSDHKENQMITPSMFSNSRFHYSIVESSLLPSQQEIKKQTTLEPNQQHTDHIFTTKKALKRKQNLLLFSFDKYVYSALRIQKLWRGYRSRVYLADYRQLKFAVRIIEKNYIDYRYRAHARLKKMLFYAETCSLNINIMLKHFFLYQQNILKTCGKRENVCNVLNKLNAQVVKQVNEGIKQVQPVQKTVKRISNNLLSPPSTDRTQHKPQKEKYGLEISDTDENQFSEVELAVPIN